MTEEIIEAHQELECDAALAGSAQQEAGMGHRAQADPSAVGTAADAADTCSLSAEHLKVRDEIIADIRADKYTLGSLKEAYWHLRETDPELAEMSDRMITHVQRVLARDGQGGDMA